MRSFSIYRNIDQPFMSVERSAKPICTFLLLMYTVNAVFLPADTYHLKVASLVILLGVGIRCWFVVDCEKPILVYGLAVTGMTIVMSIVMTGDVIGNIRGGYMGFILLLYPIIKYYRIDYEKMLMNTLLFMSWLILFIAVMRVFKIMDIKENPIAVWLQETGNAGFWGSDEDWSNFKYFLKASPMLVIALPYFFRKRRYFSFLLVFLAMFCSGTRANQIICILVAFCCIAISSNDTADRVQKSLIMIIISSIILLEGSLIDYFVSYFARKGRSDAMREATKDTILSIWRDDHFSLITGSGYSTPIFDPTRFKLMPIVEVSYWNLLRQIGIIPFIMMMGMYIYPAIRLVNENRELSTVAAWIGYLAISYNDPLLYSTTAMTATVYLYCLCFNKSEEAILS